MNQEYKATGRQLDVSPETKGVLYDKWLHGIIFSNRPLCTRADLAAYLAKPREQPKKAGKKQSGALPGNSEWL